MDILPINSNSNKIAKLLKISPSVCNIMFVLFLFFYRTPSLPRLRTY